MTISEIPKWFQALLWIKETVIFFPWTVTWVKSIFCLVFFLQICLLEGFRVWPDEYVVWRDSTGTNQNNDSSFKTIILFPSSLSGWDWRLLEGWSWKQKGPGLQGALSPHLCPTALSSCSPSPWRPPKSSCLQASAHAAHSVCTALLSTPVPPNCSASTYSIF